MHRSGVVQKLHTIHGDDEGTSLRKSPTQRKSPHRPRRALSEGYSAWMQSFSNSNSSFRSKSVYTDMVCEQFMNLVAAAERSGSVPNQVCTAVACDLYNNLSMARLNDAHLRERQRLLNLELFKHIYMETDEIDAAIAGGPKGLMELTPCFDIVRELDVSIMRYEEEYKRFGLEFDEVKEMVDRTVRVINHTIKIWKTYSRKVAFAHWRLVVRKRSFAATTHALLVDRIRRTKSRQLRRQTFQNWVVWILERKTVLYRDRRKKLELNLKLRSIRNEELTIMIEETKEAIKLNNTSSKTIIDENNVLKGLLSNVYSDSVRLTEMTKRMEITSRLNRKEGTEKPEQDPKNKPQNVWYSVSQETVDTLIKFHGLAQSEAGPVRSQINEWLRVVMEENQLIFCHYSKPPSDVDDIYGNLKFVDLMAMTEAQLISVLCDSHVLGDSFTESDFHDLINRCAVMLHWSCSKSRSASIYQSRARAEEQSNTSGDNLTAAKKWAKDIGALDDVPKVSKKYKNRPRTAIVRTASAFLDTDTQVYKRQKKITFTPAFFIECLVFVAVERIIVPLRRSPQIMAMKRPAYREMMRALVPDLSISDVMESDMISLGQFQMENDKMRAPKCPDVLPRKEVEWIEKHFWTKNERGLPRMEKLLDREQMRQLLTAAFDRGQRIPFPGILQCLKTLCKDFIFVHAHRGAAKTFLATMVFEKQEPDKRMEGANNNIRLKMIYHSYATDGSGSKADYHKTAGSMCLSKFVQLMRDCNLDEILTPTVIYRLFEYIQSRDTQSTVRGNKNSDDKVACSFKEFQMGVAAAAGYYYPDPSTPFEIKYQKFVEQQLKGAKFHWQLAISDGKEEKKDDTADEQCIEEEDLEEDELKMGTEEMPQMYPEEEYEIDT